MLSPWPSHASDLRRLRVYKLQPAVPDSWNRNWECCTASSEQKYYVGRALTMRWSCAARAVVDGHAWSTRTSSMAWSPGPPRYAYLSRTARADRHVCVAVWSRAGVGAARDPLRCADAEWTRSELRAGLGGGIVLLAVVYLYETVRLDGPYNNANVPILSIITYVPRLARSSCLLVDKEKTRAIKIIARWSQRSISCSRSSWFIRPQRGRKGDLSVP